MFPSSLHLRRPRRIARPAPITAALLAVTALLGLAACGWVPKRVTEKDCADWSEHLVQIVRTDVSDRLEHGCDAEESAKKLLVSSIERLFDREKLLQDCRQQVGKFAPRTQTECLTKAQKIADLEACRGSTDEGLGQLQEGLGKLRQGLDRFCSMNGDRPKRSDVAGPRSSGSGPK